MMDTVKAPQLRPPQVAFTAMVVVAMVVQDPVVKVYEIKNEPTPDTEGSKVPAVLLVIPVPLQVPPATDAVRLKAGLVVHNEPTGLMVAVGAALTVISVVLVSLHPPTAIE